MPTYAYACTACGHAFDAVQKFSDAALTECPECAGRLRKVYTSIGVTFKGSGFYRNDSRASSSSGKSGEKSTSEKSADTSSSSSSEKSGASASSTSSSVSSSNSSSSTAAAS
ncbi:MAG TPA: FmdB family zinc ribbon protein [Lapillicoccus sp.]|nr:FmdB family zinc ribbon protein [Lapillicoccus sp.]